VITLYVLGAVLLGMGSGLIFVAILEMDREGWEDIKRDALKRHGRVK